MSFKNEILKYAVKDIQNRIIQKNTDDVRLAIRKSYSGITLDDFLALISPAAKPFLEEIATISHHLTMQRFGNNMQLYAPVYLSNECQNICTYCGFSLNNKFKRITLSEHEIIKEIEIVKNLGFDHVLLVSGEANQKVGIEYFKKLLPVFRQYFSNISMEVQPLAEQEYKELISLGLNSVLVYQESYNQQVYKLHHPKGKKSNFHYRLDTPDRLGKAGIYKIGIGFLIGLDDWKTEAFYTALHLSYLRKNYWQTKYSISFPRLRPAKGIIDNNTYISDYELTQLICAYRIFDPDVELSLSTRESEKFRNNILKLGITSMSAGSKTNPGGYYHHKNYSLEQFEISDERSPERIAKLIIETGYEPVWKDWDKAYQNVCDV